MPDNSSQADMLCRLGGVLLARYERDPHAFVGINVQLRYRDGADTRALVPDVFVVFGVAAKKRSSYSVWEEGKVPDFVLEVASEGTYRKDLGSKKDAYEEMGVPEYGVVDPKGDMHRPRLQLYRLDGSVYKPVSGRSGPDGSLAVTSETLGLELRLEEDDLRLWDPEAREYLADQQAERARYEEERTGRVKEREGRLKEREGRLKERARYEEMHAQYEEMHAQYEEERTGRLKERASRIAAEQRAHDAETELADFKERLRGNP